MEALISPDLMKRLEQLQLLARRRSKSTAKGERRSGARGQSVEFADYRTYVPGDDLRRIDWNLFGRFSAEFLLNFAGIQRNGGRELLRLTVSCSFVYRTLRGTRNS